MSAPTSILSTWMAGLAIAAGAAVGVPGCGSSSAPPVASTPSRGGPVTLDADGESASDLVVATVDGKPIWGSCVAHQLAAKGVAEPDTTARKAARKRDSSVRRVTSGRPMRTAASVWLMSSAAPGKKSRKTSNRSALPDRFHSSARRSMALATTWRAHSLSMKASMGSSAPATCCASPSSTSRLRGAAPPPRFSA